MNLRSIFTALAIPHARPQMQIMRDFTSFLRIHFLYSAIESGLLEALRVPTSRQELIQKLHIQRPELLDVLLDLGVSLQELSQENGLYQVQGRRARALHDRDSLVALIQEYVTYHASVYRHLAARLTGAPLGNYLEGTGNLLARAARTYEPFIKNFMHEIVRTGGPLRMLDVGCGSGVYLRLVAEMAPQAIGFGVDMRAEVVDAASANLAKWGIWDRFKVLVADIRQAPAELDGPFDLITLFNNAYYFTPAERLALFRVLRARLVPDGALAIVSSVRESNHAMTIDFDLVCRSTAGCAPVPTLDEIILELHDSGFRRMRKYKLLPVEPLYGIVAT